MAGAQVVAEVFISYVQEDGELAAQMAFQLESRGVKTWYYGRDSLPGPAYLLQVSEALRAARVILVIVSESSLCSRQEIVTAYETGRLFSPRLCRGACGFRSRGNYIRRCPAHY
jgi:hypothetical protein